MVSVLGVQSSGKSTLLNMMFNLDLIVSDGRCTKGAFLQLLKVDNEDSKFKYILLIDTEGLRSAELGTATQETTNRDNKLATMIIALSDLILINTFGESATQITEIIPIVGKCIQEISANIVEKSQQLLPKVFFVHQGTNISNGLTEEFNHKVQSQNEKMINSTKDIVRKILKYQSHGSDSNPDNYIDLDEKNIFYFRIYRTNNFVSAEYLNDCENLKAKILSAECKNITTLETLKKRLQVVWEGVNSGVYYFDYRTSIVMYQNIMMRSLIGKLSKEFNEEIWEIYKEINIKIGENYEKEMQRMTNGTVFRLEEISEEQFRIPAERILNAYEKKYHEKDKGLDGDPLSFKDLIEKYKREFMETSENTINVYCRKINIELSNNLKVSNAAQEKFKIKRDIEAKCKKFILELKDQNKDEQSFLKEAENAILNSVEKIQIPIMSDIKKEIYQEIIKYPMIKDKKATFTKKMWSCINQLIPINMDKIDDFFEVGFWSQTLMFMGLKNEPEKCFHIFLIEEEIKILMKEIDLNCGVISIKAGYLEKHILFELQKRNLKAKWNFMPCVIYNFFQASVNVFEQKQNKILKEFTDNKNKMVAELMTFAKNIFSIENKQKMLLFTLEEKISPLFANYVKKNVNILNLFEGGDKFSFTFSALIYYFMSDQKLMLFRSIRHLNNAIKTMFQEILTVQMGPENNFINQYKPSEYALLETIFRKSFQKSTNFSEFKEEFNKQKNQANRYTTIQLIDLENNSDQFFDFQICEYCYQFLNFQIHLQLFYQLLTL